jgi:hypothetical protein
MSHTPPIPPANQAPFPRHEKPHEHVATPATAAPQAEPRSLVGTLEQPRIGLAVGLGLAALAGIALWYRASSKTTVSTPKPRRAKVSPKPVVMRQGLGVKRTSVRRRGSAAPAPKVPSPTD